ncbi:MAG: sulfite oxidase-like oxidoreductase [Planctomycetota bacterium]
MNDPEMIASSDTLRGNRVPPGQTAVRSIDKQTGKLKWPVLHAGTVPYIDPEHWSLSLFGLVENPLKIAWNEFQALPKNRVKCDIHCVTQWSRLDNVFEGPTVRTVLELVQLSPKATHVLVHAHGPARDHWTTNLPLSYFADEDCLFATHHDGEPLTPEHGGPVRLVVPKLYFWKSAKWVMGVEFLSKDMAGFWEEGGYHMRGDPWLEERYS